jgi:hypothetical protein
MQSFLVLLGAFLGGLVSGLAGFGTGLTALGIWLQAVDPPLAAPLVVICSVASQALTFPQIWNTRHISRLQFSNPVRRASHLHPVRFYERRSVALSANCSAWNAGWRLDRLRNLSASERYRIPSNRTLHFDPFRSRPAINNRALSRGRLPGRQLSRARRRTPGLRDFTAQVAKIPSQGGCFLLGDETVQRAVIDCLWADPLPARPSGEAESPARSRGGRRPRGSPRAGSTRKSAVRSIGIKPEALMAAARSLRRLEKRLREIGAWAGTIRAWSGSRRGRVGSPSAPSRRA